ncbi:hypothetical protein ALQ33_00796 [Pseudomonas syringae pv. philadelphi]|uniref:Uncharacterized protein n=2 Tax=Pseudomonas syringae group genomosp. 3 TaxID=251701 RepID=A0A3M3ZSV9_9PSED|nr:hypothetical protein [Pseudomonas syringae group genomosp. 3]RMO97718.1 hypothetical protein ALQ33_00796 [Pseudomonas syringae pv. philadelphi]
MSNTRAAHEGLSADENDAEDFVHRRKPRKMRQSHRYILTFLIIASAAGGVAFHYANTVAPVVAKLPDASVQKHSLPGITSSTEPSPKAEARPQTLPECIGPDNLIDEAVVTCRFGKNQKAVTGSTAQGMVSARYMSQYKAQQQMHPPKLAAAQFIESAIVWQWDRKRTYRAEWVITDNQIDDTSVCRNWRGGSIEYRECRKGAKVYFKEQCKRLAESASRQRYCSAASGFSPLG